MPHPAKPMLDPGNQDGNPRPTKIGLFEETKLTVSVSQGQLLNAYWNVFFDVRLDLLNNLEVLHQDMDRKDEQQERLLGQMRDLLSKYEESEEQKKRYVNELETVTKKLKEAAKDVQDLEGQLEDKENQLKESDKKRAELRNKALQSIKE